MNQELWYEFECGCKIRQFGNHAKLEDGLPSMEIDYYNLRDCPAVWKSLKTGYTKGIFQLESPLGQSWCKKIEPSSIEEMCALISIIRPGVLNAILGNGKSMAQTYVDRKKQIEDSSSLHPELNSILSMTYNVMLYQEQMMQTAAILAGLDENKVDKLRKAMGKKDVNLMADVEKMFIEGCKTVGKCTEEEAKQIFSYIKESQRYSFNKSHGIGYGSIGYATAWVKHHLPLHFYTAWLMFADEKIDPEQEKSDLIIDAKTHGIEVYPPSAKNLENTNYDGDFTMTQKGVYFGINNVKRIGMKHTEMFINNVRDLEKKLSKPIKDWTWFQIMTQLGTITTKTVINNLIAVGMFSFLKQSRREMLFEYSIWDELVEREQQFILTKPEFTNLKDSLITLLEIPRKEGGPSNKIRVAKIKSLITTLEDPPHKLIDDALWISNNERELLSISITSTALDTCKNVVSTHSCKDVVDGYCGKLVLGVEIKASRENTIKRGKSIGKKMAFLTATDNSATLTNVVCFAEVWAKYSHILYTGATVILEGKADKDSVIVNKVIAI